MVNLIAMTYDQTLQFLYSKLPAWHRIGKAAYKSDLANIQAFDVYMGRPHEKYRTIHVAGTNGKGSVSHMMASVLMEAGYKTGLYTSPHLKDFRERIRVNGKMIPKSSVIRFVRRHMGIMESLNPSFFEVTVAMAFSWFEESGVDVAVIETGLGGRLDSTNIITPLLSVITNIGHDHMDLLGDSLQLIAWEKAGIIKDGIPVVISEYQEETSGIFIEKVRETRSPIWFADRENVCEFSPFQRGAVSRGYTLRDNGGKIQTKGKSVLLGDYQSKNIQAVYQSFRAIEGVLPVTTKNISDGIRRVIINTKLAGRWQIINSKPLTICDTAHNREGLLYVMSQIKNIKRNHLHIIIGFVDDKDLALVLPLFPAEATYYFTRASVPRALDEEILKTEASRYGLKGISFPDVRSALDGAVKNSAEEDLIFIGGSTFIVADVI